MVEPLISESLRRRLEGRPLCVHASMRSFAPRLSADVVLDALLAIDCTIMVPTFTYELEQPAPDAERPPRNGTDYSRKRSEHEHRYDARQNELSRREMGALPAALLERDRIRGEHPLNSFAAVGRLAGELIERQTYQDVYQPFASLIEHDGYVVLMGVGCTSMTLIHYAEERAGRSLFQRWARDRNGQRVVCATGSCSTAFGRFDRMLQEERVTVSGSLWRVIPAAAAVEAASSAIRENPTITACGRAGCLRCRDAVAGGPLPIAGEVE